MNAMNRDIPLDVSQKVPATVSVDHQASASNSVGAGGPLRPTTPQKPSVTTPERHSRLEHQHRPRAATAENPRTALLCFLNGVTRKRGEESKGSALLSNRGEAVDELRENHGEVVWSSGIAESAQLAHSTHNSGGR
jgi:hypothetical protein